MTGWEDKPAEVRLEPLTRRQTEILALLAQGYSGPEIAAKLVLTLSSVRFHLKHLYGKLGVNSKRQALNRAAELGLLEPPPAASTVGAPPDAPPVPAARHNLPLPVSRFFGREAELAQLRGRLDENRLVTLTGAGGSGKTCLSLRAAEELLPDFSDGVWLVELAPLSDAALVAPQLAASLGLRDDPGQPSLETLTAFLRERQALLVLDNYEHLLDACGWLADRLLRACPRVRLLATSREPLGIAGEAVFVVPALPFPDPSNLPPLDLMTEYAAVSLFLDRARLAQPDYAVTVHNAAAVARICQRLDGLPLALEMAAARLSILNVEQLAAGLDDAFRLLAGGSRSALPRQQTLRATIDWSYNLLSLPERALFQRLAVFAGGFTLAAAEAVCAEAALPPAEVMGQLAALVGKSLVLADRPPAEAADQAPRYRLLEVMRQYAHEKLRAAGDEAHRHARHRDYYAVFVEADRPKLQSAEWPRWVRRLTAERENIRQALEWSFGDASQPEIGPRLALAMGGQWATHQEAVDWLLRAVAVCERQAGIAPRLYADVLGQAAHAVAGNDPQAALLLAQQCVAVSRELVPADPEALFWNLIVLGWTYLDLWEPAQAEVIYSEAEALLQDLERGQSGPEQHQDARVHLAYCRAKAALGLGQYQAAKRQASETLRRASGGEGWLVARHYLTLGEACLKLREYEPAREHLLDALDLIEASGDGHKAYVLSWLAAVDEQQGQLERALAYCHASLHEAEKITDRNIIASCLGVCASIAARQGQPVRAATLSGASAALWARQKRKPWEDSALDTLLPGWRAGPDAAALSAAFEAGQVMTADVAVAAALNEHDS